MFETAQSAHHAGGDELRVFTTRPDTLFGATFMVLAPEHPLVPALTAPDRRPEVDAYVARAETETEIERLSADREKTGVPIGAYAINPVNGERVPIFVADYVLAGYGTGAIMAVPRTTSVTTRSRRSSAWRSVGSSRGRARRAPISARRTSRTRTTRC